MRPIADLQDVQAQALQKFLDLIRRPGSDYDYPWGNRLLFDKSGAARLGHFAGLLYGLTMLEDLQTPLESLSQAHTEGSPRAIALHTAHELHRCLTRLSHYGGDREFQVDRGQQQVQVPAFKIRLMDGGDYGFSLGWYRVMTNESLYDKARSIEKGWKDEGKYDDLTADMENADSWLRQAAMEAAREQLRIDKEMEEWRSFESTWMKEKRAEYEAKHAEHTAEIEAGYLGIHGCPKCNVGQYELMHSRELFHYSYSHNGGLILSGLGDGTTLSWGIHT